MRFNREPGSASNVVRSYGGGELRVNEAVYRGAIILSASTVLSEPNFQKLDDLIGMDVSRVLRLEPELVLLGTGAQQIFPPASFGAQFLRAGIGFEVMDTGAACRTFNVLVGEQRRVVAMLLA
jgi:uncharacterized protein